MPSDRVPILIIGCSALKTQLLSSNKKIIPELVEPIANLCLIEAVTLEYFGWTLPFYYSDEFADSPGTLMCKTAALEN